MIDALNIDVNDHSIQTVEVRVPGYDITLVEVRQGPSGPAGSPGPAGPNNITTATTTNLTGFLSGNGATVTASTSATFGSGSGAIFNGGSVANFNPTCSANFHPNSAAIFDSGSQAIFASNTIKLQGTTLQTSLNFVNPTVSNKTITFPDATGTVAMTNDPRGQISIQGNTTATNIITSGSFVQAGVVGTLDTLTDIDFTASGSGKFGMTYTGLTTKTFWVTGSLDSTAGNNHTLAVRIAKNGTSIPETECRAFTGSGGAEAKLVTTWMIELSTGNEITLMIANTSSDQDATIRRGRLVINCIP